MALSKHIVHPTEETLGKIPRCVSPVKDCTTLLYAPKGVAWVDSLMKHVSHLLQTKHQPDIQGIRT